jgi:hypothetical protein
MHSGWRVMGVEAQNHGRPWLGVLHRHLRWNVHMYQRLDAFSPWAPALPEASLTDRYRDQRQGQRRDHPHDHPEAAVSSRVGRWTGSRW